MNLSQKKGEVDIESMMGEYDEIPFDESIKICGDLNYLYGNATGISKQELVKLSKKYCLRNK